MSWPWRRRQRNQQTLQNLANEQSLRGPERAYYQRLAGDYSMVSSNGKLTLTVTHVVFTSFIGASVSVPLADVAEVRDQKIRRFHVRGHDSQLDTLSSLTSIPVANLLLILVGMPLIAVIGGWLLGGREPRAIGRRPLD